MSACKSFAPIADEDSRILILGSMPGIKSLEQQEYYAHPQNRFWRLLALLLQEEVPQDYAAKQALLHKHHVALWDTLGYCERDGSLDSNIKNEAPNAVVELAGELPHLQAVVCNGGKAGAAFKKYFAKKMPERVQVFYLSSTSPANARLCLEDLAEHWQVILQFLA